MLAIRAERGFDGERLVPGGVVVLLDEGRIVAVGRDAMAVPADVRVVDFPDATVLPGLVDAHVHLCGDGRLGALERLPEYDDPGLAGVIRSSLAGQLAAGVTSVRDLGDRRAAVLDWRSRTSTPACPHSVAPTIVASGPPITSRDGHCANMGGEATGPEQLRAAVRDRVDRGADLVKVMASGGVMTPGSDPLLCQFQLAELRVVVEEAHAAGLPVTAHAHGLPAVEQAVDAEVDGIEHCTCLTPSGIQMPDRLLRRLASRGTVVCPTLGRAAGSAPPAAVLAIMQRTGVTWEARQAHAARMHRAGVRLVSGSDGGISPRKPHTVLPEAVADLVAGGVSAADALATATWCAAQSCGLGKHKGRLRAGYDADLLLVDGNPLDDIGALRRVSAVILNGAIVDKTADIEEGPA